MKKVVLLIAIILAAGVSKLIAQEEDSSERSKFGIGTTFFNYNDLIESDFDIPIPRMILTIDAIDNFRIEPSIGFIRTDNQFLYNIGLGVFVKSAKPNFNLIYGLKASYSSSSKSGFASSPDEITSFGPVVGGEYLFNRHFSLGSQVSIKALKIDNDIFVYNDASIIVRFYF
jgi:hypothetical protein